MAFSFFGKKKDKKDSASSAASAGKQDGKLVISASTTAPAEKPKIIFGENTPHGSESVIRERMAEIAKKADEAVGEEPFQLPEDIAADKKAERTIFGSNTSILKGKFGDDSEDDSVKSGADSVKSGADSVKSGADSAKSDTKNVEPIKPGSKPAVAGTLAASGPDTAKEDVNGKVAKNDEGKKDGEDKAVVKNEGDPSPSKDLSSDRSDVPDELKDDKEAGKDTLRVGSMDSFYLDLRPKVIDLPPFKDLKEIDVRYPLIAPYAYAHIYFNKKENELIYNVEEPSLDENEKELLSLIQIGLEEMINISFVRASKSNLVLEYLEKNVRSILIELGAKVSKKTYNKLLYYIYRNSVGLNEIEPLLNDYYVEDIECNGIKFPIYIVHRKYQNLRTSVIFNDSSYMTDFIEKLAQKSGRYISFAKPLLDGTLPDGSRVNATYSDDITTRGPTFTIRKFTKDPWTPIHLIQTKTASAESFAYMWLIVENKFNLMIVGETASGKTTYMNCIVDFIPPEARICSIEDTRELNLAHINWLPAVTRAGFGMPTIMGTQYGEVTLFDLLKESFRQNPDYVIVGEIRGKEAYVLFQGMASGHPSYSTFHAASVDTVVKRLETPPINLSPSLVEALDVVCICVHVKDQHRNFRRLKEIDEIQEVEQALGRAKYNEVLKWDPAKDKHNFQKTTIFKRISARTGQTEEQITEEMRKRTALLQILADKNINGFKEFNKILNDYYKDPESVLKRFGVK